MANFPSVSSTFHLARHTLTTTAQLAGVTSVTIRTWSRRYSVPALRPDGLYSDYDVQVLRWLKVQTQAGMNIRRATKRFAELREAGLDPALTLPVPTLQPASVSNLVQQSLAAFLALDEASALQAFRLAFSIYPLDTVLVKIIQPVLVEIGERWQRGEATIAVEHFATQFCVRHLMNWLSLAEAPTHPGLIVAACAPGERHEIGLLILVVMLRWRGWEVQYLGPDLSLERLDEVLGSLHPRLLLFTATRPEAARALQGVPQLLQRFPPPRPQVVLGGQAFSGRSTKNLAGPCLRGLPSQMVHKIEKLMQAEP